ncbi:hypothetical protein TNCV_3409521 [Trichonephila clavipes]|nr:hypothetical protein TNCV_3409521 [Trichonephila clavipes]
MVFQERMLHGKSTEARLEEILQSGKEYLPQAMHLTDQNSGVHLSDLITFMTEFRIIVNSLQPPEIIDLHTDTEQRLVELLTKVLPHHHALDFPRVRSFGSFEPKDVSSDYLE